MISIISGAIVFGVTCVALWVMVPKKGVTHHLATVPVLDSVIPTSIIAAFAVGVALIVSGALS